ncbi:hypothetical protein [Companilactobacillus nodensis]|uniref:Uncharacterized protein n=1 Tax=Companilactobacillus nodensis DSM 19682 = JCM 14932 = NBRC 107160 TaxID=1423775 RepID=A0A0R1KP71_9LACO|nr:hypothetical protein [Companilactobacillus nodensis]KRK81143.1 hypothetical protein FD03_GL000735 [Companilactobacillus nodensis DSM 19682 = JCM 14932 = NBRC 107160]
MFKFVDGKLRPVEIQNALDNILSLMLINCAIELVTNIMDGITLLNMDYRWLFRTTMLMMIAAKAWNYCIKKFKKN